MQQTIVAFDHTLYKLMAAGQKPIATDPHFSVSFQSFKILDPAPSSPGKWSANDIARKVGIIVVALGFVAFAVYVLRSYSRNREVRKSSSKVRVQDRISRLTLQKAAALIAPLDGSPADPNNPPF